MSRLESLVFPWLRRVYGGSRKTSPFRRLPSRLSCRFAWQAWHFVTFQHVLYRVESVKIGGSLARNARFAAPTCLVSGHSLAGVALCDSPTCFIPCRKCQNWRKSRTKCSFCCSQTAIRGSHERLRTVANGCGRERNVERTHPQPPDPQSETGTLATHSGMIKKIS